MINNNAEYYEKRKVKFEADKDTLPKEPSGDVKKEYCVGCFQKSDWEYIHEELMKDGSLEDNIPTDKCDCINDCLQSDIRGIYLLTETEASELRANPKVNYVHVNTSAYPGTYLQNPDDLTEGDVPISYRYASTVKNQQDTTATGVGIRSDISNSNKLNRCSGQLYRHSAKKSPWVTLGDPQTVVDNRLQQYGTAADVDVIVCDEDMWFGHIEFCNPSGITDIKLYDPSEAGDVGGNSSTLGPSNYVGGNVLKNGFASSATTGICDVLDLVLDGPYYIDPDWFEADPSNRLMTRWDGTTVPVESVARDWWWNVSKRSASYASIGTVFINSLYTRARCNGSNTAYKTGGGYHGTPCASQAYGRQYGWAYNANKWHMTVMGIGSVGDSDMMEIQKIFHENKPNRSSDNTKNPTVSSNSWAYIISKNTSGGYYYYRQGTDGSGGAEFTSWSYTGGSSGEPGGVAPRFMTNFYQSSGIRMHPQSGSAVDAGNELIASGVIFCCSAGNGNQKLVDGSHPDFNNYFSDNDNTALSSTTFTHAEKVYLKTINRPGYPGAIGKTGSGASTRYSTIQVGCLDDTYSSGKERKVDYSNMGMAVDCYTIGDGSMAACDDESNYYPGGYAADSESFGRHDAFYTYNSSQSVLSHDCQFGGTSSACPIAAGLIATKLQYNRTWTYTDVKDWMKSTVGEQDTADFYTVTEATSVNDTNWTDDYNIQGGSPIVLFDTPISTPDPTPKLIISGVTMSGSNGKFAFS